MPNYYQVYHKREEFAGSRRDNLSDLENVTGLYAIMSPRSLLVNASLILSPTGLRRLYEFILYNLWGYAHPWVCVAPGAILQ
jgi:hypothetical protein